MNVKFIKGDWGGRRERWLPSCPGMAGCGKTSRRAKMANGQLPRECTKGPKVDPFARRSRACGFGHNPYPPATEGVDATSCCLPITGAKWRSYSQNSRVIHRTPIVQWTISKTVRKLR